MCVGFVFINSNLMLETYQLIVINNRDEYYERTTEKLSFKNDHVLGSIDSNAGHKKEAWLALSTKGKLAMLLDTFPKIPRKGLRRGHLVDEFVNNANDLETFVEKLWPKFNCYKPMTLVLLEKKPFLSHENSSNWNCVVLNSENSEVKKVNEEFFAVGVSPLNETLLKTMYGEEKFKAIITRWNHIDHKEKLLDELIMLLRDRTRHWPDPCLYRPADHPMFSSLFVSGNLRGTRTHSIILIDGQGNGTYIEINRTRIIDDIKECDSNNEKKENEKLKQKNVQLCKDSKIKWIPKTVNFKI